MKLISFWKKMQLPSQVIYSVILIFNLMIMVVLLIQTSTLNKSNSSKLIKNYYLSDTIRRLCPKNQQHFSTNLGNLSKKSNGIEVQLKNGYQRVFPLN